VLILAVIAAAGARSAVARRREGSTTSDLDDEDVVNIVLSGYGSLLNTPATAPPLVEPRPRGATV